ncbi:ankyrin [Coniochaeta ligniaria NRRL 30616]|uniref:Ankyrin n=1 Tax=Coniochaeta ligniaria NRRL 30616 TaxID=1408157 RepID=A0A1J7J1A8_9PEZI|nr:ankyrin [Coniochaeta ligniaria NRRL 30616]
MGQKLDICLSSRHYPTITAPRSVDLVVEDGNQVDIERYIQRKVPYGVMSDPASVAALHALLLQKASGIFLWVVLVVEIVLRDVDEGRASWEIERSLAEVPDDLVALFSDLIRSLGSKERLKSRALISLVLLAKQPIPAQSTTALQVLMNETLHELDDTTDGLLRLTQGFVLSWDQDMERIRRMVRAMSRGLIEINRFHHLQFIHETVRGFFVTEGARIFNAPRFTSVSHCMITRAWTHALCILQLTKPKPRVGDNLRLALFDETFHIDWLQDYVRFLPHHATEARRETVLPNQLIHSVDRIVAIISRRRISAGPSAVMFDEEAYKYAIKDIVQDGLGPHILNNRHLVSCCVSTAFLCNRIVNALDTDQEPHCTPLADSAMSAISPDDRHWRLRPESDYRTSFWGSPLIRSDPNVLEPVALQIGQSRQRDAMIKLHRLLSSGISVQSRDGEGNTLLHVAAWQGMPELIDTICDHGHPVDILNNYGMTPLCFAAQYGHSDAAARLLARGASASLPGPDGCTPLHLSMETTNLAMTRLLIASGASVSARDALGQTPLHAAAKYNVSEDVITILINADADSHALDDNLVTPMMIALYYGRNALHWPDPRARWAGHKTNYVKMMESRVGYRQQSSSAGGRLAAESGLLSPWRPPPGPPPGSPPSPPLSAPAGEDGQPVDT